MLWCLFLSRLDKKERARAQGLINERAKFPQGLINESETFAVTLEADRGFIYIK